MVGGWDFTNPQQPDDVEPELAKVFEETMQLDGVGYKMLQLSGCQASARNYLFICEATTVTLEPKKHIAVVTLHLEGAGDKASILNIAEVY